MPSYSPPLKNSAYVFYVSLVSQANTKIMQASATLASGDVKVAVDDAAPANLATLPVVDADYTKRIKVSLSASEMNGDRVTVIFSDASGAEWCDLTIDIATVTNQFDSLATLAAIAALNNLSAAQVNAEVDTALADYDAPTRAELTSDIASLATFIDTEVAAILVDTGTDIPALIDALPTATEVWANATRTLTSGGGASAADVWGYVTRTLTQTAAQVAASVTGSDLAIVRAVTFTATLTGLTIPATWSKIYFTAKRHRAVADTEAVVQIVVSNPAAPLTDGLLRINRAAGTLAHGSLVVDQALGTVAITLADNATTLLVADAYVYDLKTLLSDGSSTLLTAANVSVGDTVTESIV